MTKIEINDIFDIPISTLNEWQKISSKKHKLYSFLIKSDKQYIDKVSNTHKTHRLFHILNRNIDKQQQYSYSEIKNAFLKEDYTIATQREQLIYSKFFKECDSDDLDSLSSCFEVSKRNIKKLYSTSPIRKLKGVAKIWDKRFRLKHFDVHISTLSQSTPSALQLILNRRVTVNV